MEVRNQNNNRRGKIFSEREKKNHSKGLGKRITLDLTTTLTARS